MSQDFTHRSIFRLNLVRRHCTTQLAKAAKMLWRRKCFLSPLVFFPNHVKLATSKWRLIKPCHLLHCILAATPSVPYGKPPAAHVALEEVVSFPTEIRASPVDVHVRASKKLIEALTQNQLLAEDPSRIVHTMPLLGACVGSRPSKQLWLLAAHPISRLPSSECARDMRGCLHPPGIAEFVAADWLETLTVDLVTSTCLPLTLWQGKRYHLQSSHGL